MNPQAQARILLQSFDNDAERAWKAAWTNSLTSESAEHREFWEQVANACCRAETLWICICGKTFSSGYEAFLHRSRDEGTTISHHVSPVPISVPMNREKE